jgi:hypothetical protein
MSGPPFLQQGDSAFFMSLTGYVRFEMTLRIQAKLQRGRAPVFLRALRRKKQP